MKEIGPRIQWNVLLLGLSAATAAIVVSRAVSSERAQFVAATRTHPMAAVHQRVANTAASVLACAALALSVSVSVLSMRGIAAFPADK